MQTANCVPLHAARAGRRISADTKPAGNCMEPMPKLSEKGDERNPKTATQMAAVNNFKHDSSAGRAGHGSTPAGMTATCHVHDLPCAGNPEMSRERSKRSFVSRSNLLRPLF